MNRHCLSRNACNVVLSLGILVPMWSGGISAQTSPITSSGLNTQISAPVNRPGGVVQHNITGGTRPGGGANLFHSFGDAGEVRISANNIVATSNTTGLLSLIDTHTSASGAAGKIDILATEQLHVSGTGFLGRLFFLDSGTTGSDGGRGGDITISAKDLQLERTRITTGDSLGQELGEDTAGSGGNVMIMADTVLMTNSQILTDGYFEGKAGDLMISARDVLLTNRSQLSLLEFEGGGTLTINAERLRLDSSQIEVETLNGRGEGIPWTGITIDAPVVELLNGSTVRSQTVGDGDAGGIRVTATERFSLFDDPNVVGSVLRPTGLYTNSTGEEGSLGSAGAIIVKTGLLEFAGGARFDSTTQSSGSGGDVHITANNGVSIAGSRPDPVLEDEIFGLGSSRPSGIFSRTVGSEFCTGPCGDAGNVLITTGFLNVTDGAAINSGTTSTGAGGTINVNTSGTIAISGMLDDGTPGGVFSRSTGTDIGSGAGGTIVLTSGQNFTLSSGATVSASSEGPGNAGNINITANDTIQIDKASVTAEALQASGGSIKLKANDTIQLVDSTIESSVQGDVTTAGGDISLDPDFIILQNSQILAKAVEGQGGNISLVANDVVLVDPFSDINASASEGISGSVDIQAPIKVLSGTIVPLPQNPAPVTNLYGTNCVASAGGHFSTFVDSKADSLAPPPGTFLASPLMLPSVQAKADNSVNQKSPVMLTASIAPLVLGHAGELTTACP